MRSAAWVALSTVGLVLGGLLVGYEPTGGDPGLLYRPVKLELARGLHQGTLPFWSDRFGLGVPLVAESHVAAFYPPNWALYGFFEVSTAYRLSMWLHYVALAGATFVYARRLGLQPWGSALAAVAVSLCGFQAIHSSHEALYTTLPYLVLALYFAEEYFVRGRTKSLALLALTFGAQLTLGHFQLATWTAGLVIVTGIWRVTAAGYPTPRIAALVVALACGAAIAAAQLVLSWNYAQFVGATSRSLPELMFYVYPPAHWPELAIPRLFQAVASVPEGSYWTAQATTGYEARFYIGTLPLILACVGFTARDQPLGPWRLIVPVTFALATMPSWWPLGYQLVLQLPGIGYFRAPARYTLITSLGLALLAGRGLDHAVTQRRFVTGLSFAVLFFSGAVAWAVYWTRIHAEAFGQSHLPTILAWTAGAWALSIGAVVAWRQRLIGPVWLVAFAALELGVLFYQGTTVWGRSIDVLTDSPVLRRLAQEPVAGTVAGDLKDLPVYAGRGATSPYLGMQMPPPTSALAFAISSAALTDPAAAQILRRMGATHAISPVPISGAEIEQLFAGADDVLDRLLNKTPGAPNVTRWHLLRLPTTPAVHVARRALDAPDLRTVLAYLAQGSSDDDAWFLPGDRPADSTGPRARNARIVNWDGLAGEVEHDGACDVVIRRTYAPGWVARLDNGPAIAVNRVDGGLQSVRVTGSGRTRISLEYHPPGLVPAAAVSLSALVLVLGVLFARSNPRQALD